MVVLVVVGVVVVHVVAARLLRPQQARRGASCVPARDRERRSAMVVGQRRRDRGEVLLLHQMQRRTIYFERHPSTVVHGRDGLYPNRNGTSARFLFRPRMRIKRYVLSMTIVDCCGAQVCLLARTKLSASPQAKAQGSCGHVDPKLTLPIL